MHGFPVIDLFAGAGGFSIAATKAGGDVRVSVEIDPTACSTLRQNPKYHGKVLEADVSELSGKGLRRAAKLTKSDPLIIVGGGGGRHANLSPRQLIGQKLALIPDIAPRGRFAAFDFYLALCETAAPQHRFSQRRVVLRISEARPACLRSSRRQRAMPAA